MPTKPKKYKLIEVQGSQLEFADLIGAVGPIRHTVDGLTFLPDGRGDWLCMRPTAQQRTGTKFSIKTGYGNTFVFEEAVGPQHSGVKR